MTVKQLKDFLIKIEKDYEDTDSWDVLINIGEDYAMVKPDAIYEGSVWNIVIDCDLKPVEINEELIIKPKK